MPPADKRARKKENARAAREERLAAIQRRKRLRTARNVGIVVAIFVGAIVLLNLAGSSKKKTVPTTTVPKTLPAGCVKTVPPQTKKPTFKSAPAMTIDPSKTYTATITTSCGPIEVALDAKNAPKGVNNFVFLAKKGFYDGLKWHRVVDGFVIQGGDPLGTGLGGPGYSVPTELPKNGYSQGTIAWAKNGQEANGTAGSQFFIVTGTDTSALAQKTNGTYQYGAFGKVTSGIANAEKMQTLDDHGANNAPVIPVYIDRVTITETGAQAVGATTSSSSVRSPSPSTSGTAPAR